MSGKPRIYLDYNATAPLHPVARAAVIEALDIDGNPSSVHREGQRARALIDRARQNVATATGANDDGILFTSGATEAANYVLSPEFQRDRSPVRINQLLVGATEHASIYAGGRFADDSVEVVAVDQQGLIDLDRLTSLLSEAGTPALVAIGLANGETGVIQPIAEIADLVHEYDSILVVDAVQAMGRIDVNIKTLGADFVLISAHKMGGPKGVGAVISASPQLMPAPMIRGGGQERGHRAGTEATSLIAGFGAVAGEVASAIENHQRIKTLRDSFEVELMSISPGAKILGRDAPRLSNTTAFVLPDVSAEVAQMRFDLSGIAISVGAACSSGKLGASHVPAAMGFAPGTSALRISLGAGTTKQDMDRCLEIIGQLVDGNAGRVNAA